MIYVFSTKTCPACAVAKKLLTDHNLAYTEVDIQNKEGFRFMRQYTKSKSIPVIVTGDTVLEGVPALQAHLAGLAT